MKKTIFVFGLVIAALGFVACDKKATEETTSNAAEATQKEISTAQNTASQTPDTSAQEPIAQAAPVQTSSTQTATSAKAFEVPADATEVKMKIKAKEKNGLVKAKVAISHDMLTYDQAKKKGLEANFITHITASAGERIVYDASTSQFLSKNPLIKFSFNGKKGEVLTIVYTQLKGEVFYATKEIK